MLKLKFPVLIHIMIMLCRIFLINSKVIFLQYTFTHIEKTPEMMSAHYTNEKETNILAQNIHKRWTVFQTQFPLWKEKHLGNLSCIFCVLVCLIRIHVNRFLNEPHFFYLDNVCAEFWTCEVLHKCSVLFSSILSH